MTRRHDAASSAVLVLFAAVVCALSRRLSLWTPEGPGDGFFPFLGGLALGLLGLGLFVHSCLGRQPPSVDAAPPVERVRFFTYLAAVVAYPFLFEPLGFVPTTFLFLLVVCRWAERARWTPALLVATLSTASCVLVFQRFLEVPLPVGILALVMR